jgi:4-diphosphocytidyl-2-C-methyl-D-erythritol kinase
MTLHKFSPCKVNFLLNILGKRADGFHELETLMHPVNLFDQLAFSEAPEGIQLTCSDASLAVDSSNLVHKAATAFLKAAQIQQGVRIHLQKKIPMAAGLGGGSGNAATTLLGLNELFGKPLTGDGLLSLAASLGSDVPFFLQDKPALATGRGEKITSLDTFGALKGMYFFLVHPGFGIATAWAYKELGRFPEALHGKAGRAEKLIRLLQGSSLAEANAEFYNSLEAPALEKYPILFLYQEFLRAEGAVAALMSGSGSTTFAIMRGEAEAIAVEKKFLSRFGNCWTGIVPL